MAKKNYKELAKEAIDFTREGLDMMIEIQELQEAIKNIPKTENYEQLVKEIIEKEKIAVVLIERATLIKRELIKDQHEAIINLINNL